MYIWLSLIEEIDYILFIRLMKAFDSVTNLYNISKNINNFLYILNSNNINLSTKAFASLTSSKIKLEANEVYLNLINQKVNIIPIYSKEYPKLLYNIYSPPLCIFSYGEISKSKKVYLHGKL